MSYLPPYAPSQRWCAGPHYMAAIRPQGQSHGRYDPAFPFRECLTLAQEVKEYENAYLTQQISFLETIHEYFTVHNLRHDPEVYHDRNAAVPAGQAGGYQSVRCRGTGGIPDCKTGF